MNAPKNLLIAVLFLATIGCAALAWTQHREILSLRDAMKPLQLRLARSEAEQASSSAKAAIAPQPVATPVSAAEPAETAPEGPPMMGRGRRFAEMMDNPEVQRLFAIQQKAGLDAKYAALFKAMNLTPEQLDKFKNLLVEKSTAMMDVMAAARAQGISPRTDRAAFQQLVANAQADIDASIRSTLGDVAFSQYQDYEHTLPQRNVVDQLQQRLSYSSTPLTPDQVNQMVQILAATSPSTAGGAGPRGIAGMAGGGNPQARVTDAAVNQALGVLAGPQLDALKQLQEEQQARAQLAAAFRNQGNGGAAAPATQTRSAPPPTRPGG